MKTISKVLVWDNHEKNINAGGPGGFCSQLFEKNSQSMHYDLLSVRSENMNFHHSLFKRIINKFLKNNYYKQLIISKFKKIKAERYKIIYFHDILNLYYLHKYIPKKTIVILQSHSPELPLDEIKSQINNKNEIALWEAAQRGAFKRANILVFPNEYIIDIYKEVITSSHKVMFLKSGSKDLWGSEKLELDKDHINIMYIGRQNVIKGYFEAVNVFSQACQKRANLKLIVIGRSTVNTIYDRNIINVGFSDKPELWMGSVDYMINCNQNSYFDLSVMEALSRGTRLILKNTGGHKWFSNKSEDIILYDDPAELEDILLNLKKPNEVSAANRQLYIDHFRVGTYIENFNSFCEEALSFEDNFN